MTGRSVLFAAPHRLLFLCGVFQLMAIMAWWGLALLNLQGVGPALPDALPPVLLHAPILLFLVLPPFFFGFLLVTFPRWLGLADATPSVYAPVGIAFAASAIFLWLGLLGLIASSVIIAFILAALGWLWALGHMLRFALLERKTDRPVTWHAWSAWVALVIGLICLIIALRGIIAMDPSPVHLAGVVGLNLFIMPVFITVSHRMIPFFAGNVVKNYVRWRPFWILSAFWAATAIATLGGATHQSQLAAAGYGLCAILSAYMAFKWWPRSAAPGLLWVLIIGFAWAPVAYLIATWSSVYAPYSDRAFIHLLTVGYVLSLVIAMVTRVTQGHSGQPLTMYPIAWVAFAMVQLAAILRLIAALHGEDLTLLAGSAIVLALGILPWVVQGIIIYVRPRVDGRPG